MHSGSKREYVVQGRVQDYWLDCFNKTFNYLDQAQNICKAIRQSNPTKDYRVVKRLTTYNDEVVE